MEIKTEILISIIGALISIIIAIIGAIFSLNNSLILKTRDLKEKYYTNYLEKLHNLAALNSSKEAIIQYTKARDELFIIANEKVIKALIVYEEKTTGNNDKDLHDFLLTELIKEIRRDLKIKDKNFPIIYLKK
jgi:hypothetical protein